MAALFAYTLLGTVRRDGAVTVYDAARRDEPGARFLVSEAPLGPETEALLRACLACLRAGTRRELAAVYVRSGRFYLVFRAPGGTALADGGDAPLARRFALLRGALLALHGARDLPPALTLSAAAPENLRVGRAGDARLCFALTERALSIPPEETERALCRAAGELTRLLFREELENRDNRALRLLAGKCAAGLYPSLPAVVKELERVEEDCAPPDWDRWAERALRRALRRLRGAGRLLLPLAALAALCAVLLFFPRAEEAEGPSEAFLIGNTVYAADPRSPSTAALAGPTPAAEAAPEGAAEAKAPAEVTDDPSRFSDHVARSGETLADVCEEDYGDAAYAPAVAAYNGLAPGGALAAGSILKLPEPVYPAGGTK